MNLTCPSCFATISIETALESASGRELMGVLAAAGPLARPLAGYLGCFRSPTRALAWDKALKLAREVQTLDSDPRVLVTALSETVEALRAKREAGDLRPLKNHNYLKQVLKTVSLAPPAPVGAIHESPAFATAPTGKRRQAIELLREWAHGSSLRIALVNGLTGMVAIGRPGTPAADMITANADMWLHWLTKHGLVESDEDCARVYSAFSSLVQQPMKEWPEPAVLAAHLPRRKPQPRIEGERFTPESIERNRAALAEAMKRFGGDD